VKAILDTHVFLWWNTDDNRLSSRLRELIADENQELFLSVASIWEMVIKCRKGLLTLPEPVGNYIPSRMERHRVLPLPVSMPHALEVSRLADHHRDPFDRLLIAQARCEGIPILTADPIFRRYEGVEILF